VRCLLPGRVHSSKCRRQKDKINLQLHSTKLINTSVPRFVQQPVFKLHENFEIFRYKIFQDQSRSNSDRLLREKKKSVKVECWQTDTTVVRVFRVFSVSVPPSVSILCLYLPPNAWFVVLWKPDEQSYCEYGKTGSLVARGRGFFKFSLRVTASGMLTHTTAQRCPIGHRLRVWLTWRGAALSC
jgi:phage shock protein PspC (stress-responsive transcriptional regulator)